MTVTLDSPRTALQYLGSRDHIYAVDVFRAFEQFAGDALPTELRPDVVRSFKMIRELERDGRWRLGTDVDPFIARMGVERDQYKRVVASGDMVRQAGACGAAQAKSSANGESCSTLWIQSSTPGGWRPG